MTQIYQYNDLKTVILDLLNTFTMFQVSLPPTAPYTMPSQLLTRIFPRTNQFQLLFSTLHAYLGIKNQLVNIKYQQSKKPMF